MMKATQFAKAQQLFDRVKELDSEIMEIEKTALLIADKKTEIKLSLKVNDLESKDERSKVLDEDGSLIMGDHNPYRLSIQMLWGAAQEQKKEEKKYTIKQEAIIPDNVALQVLGVLLAGKMEARTLAIKALNKIGIDI